MNRYIYIYSYALKGQLLVFGISGEFQLHKITIIILIIPLLSVFKY